MDTILEVPNTEYDFTDYITSLWIVENNYIKPSSDLMIKTTLDPGMYIIDVHRDHGLYCKKVDSSTDELFNLSNNKIISLINEINSFWDKKELYLKNKLIHKRGILLEGYAGVGKTSIISLLSNEIIKSGGLVFKITSPKNLYYYSTFIKQFFRKIQPDTPIITIIEDIDSYNDVYFELLELLDGNESINHNLVIATTNNTENLDDIFLRPSRIDLRIEIELPDETVRRQYFVLKNVPLDKIEELINKSEGFSVADLKELYISIFILGYSIDDAVHKLKTVVKKKNYLSKNSKKESISI